MKIDTTNYLRETLPTTLVQLSMVKRTQLS